MSQPLWQRAALLKSSVAILGSRVIIPLAFLILSIAVGRILGPEGLGRYAIVMSLYVIFSLISSMGLENLILRDISRQPEKAGEYVSHILVLGIISSLACSLMMIAASHLLGYDADIRRHLLWMCCIFLPGFINISSELVFIAKQRAAYAFLLALMREGPMVLLSIYWLMQGWGLRGVIFALILSRLLGAGLAFILFRRLGIRVSRRLQPAFFKRLVALIPPFLLINVLSNVLLEIDIIVLSKLTLAPDVGLYMVAKKLVRASFLLVYSAVTALFPGISQAFQRSDPRFATLFANLWRKALLASALLAGGVTVMGPWMVSLTYGSQYTAAVPLMRILAWGLIPLSLSFLLSRFLIIGDQQNKDLMALAITVVVLAASGITASWKWGSYGMAGAYLGTISLLAVIHYALAQRYLFKPYAARLGTRHN